MGGLAEILHGPSYRTEPKLLCPRQYKAVLNRFIINERQTHLRANSYLEPKAACGFEPSSPMVKSCSLGKRSLPKTRSPRTSANMQQHDLVAQNTGLPTEATSPPKRRSAPSKPATMRSVSSFSQTWPKLQAHPSGVTGRESSAVAIRLPWRCRGPVTGSVATIGGLGLYDVPLLVSRTRQPEPWPPQIQQLFPPP